MYVTRPLSLYRRDPSALQLPPPDGPNSGILVIQDDEDDESTRCFGCSGSNKVKDLPFPQNKNLRTEYWYRVGYNQHVDINNVVFIPVLDHPLSSNLYYVVDRRGKHKGKAHANSKEEDMEPCCCWTNIPDMKPKELEPADMYQQFEICKMNRGGGGYVAKSVASDGFPPSFLRVKGWKVAISDDFELNELAPGLDSELRNRLPEFNFPVSQTSSAPPVVVGKWYCPFMFVKEGSLEEQMVHSRYYKMTLEQRWEQIFTNGNFTNAAVTVDVAVRTKEVWVYGREAVVDEGINGTTTWFRSVGNGGGQVVSVGLSSIIMERMRREEEERGGWEGGNERVVRVEEFGGEGECTKFGCYVMVERFVLRRMNGSLVFTCDFKHTNKIRTKWE